MVSFDLADGYYTLGIVNEAGRYLFTVDYRGITLYRLACMPMGWRCISYYFCKLTTDVFVRHLRAPEPPSPSDPAGPSPARPKYVAQAAHTPLPPQHALGGGHGCCPTWTTFYFSRCRKDRRSRALRDRVVALLDQLGPSRNPDNGNWQAVHVCEHPGLTIDMVRGKFRAPEAKLAALS
eukprot:jgi/Tetstr1/455752/TSEL_042551.t1